MRITLGYGEASEELLLNYSELIRPFHKLQMKWFSSSFVDSLNAHKTPMAYQQRVHVYNQRKIDKNSLPTLLILTSSIAISTVNARQIFIKLKISKWL